jgi:hypothetical protein
MPKDVVIDKLPVGKSDSQWISYTDAINSDKYLKGILDSSNELKEGFGDLAKSYSNKPPELSTANFNFGYDISSLAKFRENEAKELKTKVLNSEAVRLSSKGSERPKEGFYFRKSDIDFIKTSNESIKKLLESHSEASSKDPKFPNEPSIRVAKSNLTGVNRLDKPVISVPNSGSRSFQEIMAMAVNRLGFGYHFKLGDDGKYSGQKTIGRHLTNRLDASDPWFFTSGGVKKNSEDKALVSGDSQKRYIEEVTGISDAQHKENKKVLADYHSTNPLKPVLTGHSDINIGRVSDESFLTDFYSALSLPSATKKDIASTVLSLSNVGSNLVRKPSKGVSNRLPNKTIHSKIVKDVVQATNNKAYDYRPHLERLNQGHSPFELEYDDVPVPSSLTVRSKRTGDVLNIPKGGGDNPPAKKLLIKLMSDEVREIEDTVDDDEDLVDEDPVDVPVETETEPVVDEDIETRKQIVDTEEVEFGDIALDAQQARPNIGVSRGELSKLASKNPSMFKSNERKLL